VISLSFLVNDFLGFHQRLHVVLFFSVLLLLEVELYHVDVDAGFENLRLFALEESVELTETLVRRKSFRLNLILVSFFIKGKTVASDGSVNGGTEVSVLFDNITLLILKLNVLSCLVHLSQDLDSLALNLSQSALFVLSLSKTNLFSSLGVLFLCLLLTLDQSGLEQVESLVLETFDVVFTLAPFTELLLFHEFTAQVEASFIRSGR